jgi:hypothetical protein
VTQDTIGEVLDKRSIIPRDAQLYLSTRSTFTQTVRLTAVEQQWISTQAIWMAELRICQVNMPISNIISLLNLFLSVRSSLSCH